MRHTSEHRCSHCGGKDEEFDAQLAIARLSLKNEQLAGVVTRLVNTMSERASRATAAGLEAPAAMAGLQNRALAVGGEPHAAVFNAFADEIARIVGGNPTIGYPECCLIGHRNPNGTIGWFCTGVLVHPQIVLTAGHCFIEDRRANVVALSTANQNDLQTAELVSIKRLAVHPRYQQTHRISDMTVIVLRQPATVAPVAITTSAELNGATKITLVGFGNDDINSTRGFGVKREVAVDMVSVRRAPADDLDADEQRLGYESDVEFVAGGNGFDSCNGDSGGPAYVMLGQARKVGGLTSRGTDTATHACGDGGIYTRIDAHLDFIRSTAADGGVNFP